MAMQNYDLVWSPEGKPIGTVRASTPSAAKRKAPKPYSRYPGEITATISATQPEPAAKAPKPFRSVYVRYWAQGGRVTLIGGVKESRSSRWGALSDAENYRDAVVENNGGPDNCGSELVWSTLSPELCRHCAGHPCQAIGGLCFGCGNPVDTDFAKLPWVYGLFTNLDGSRTGWRWRVTRDLKDATAHAAMPGWEVRRMHPYLYDDGNTGCPGDIVRGWDAPTFRVSSDPFKP